MSIREAWRSLTLKGYSEDGLATEHIGGFLDDEKFIRAYRAGERTGSWHGAKLRWRVYTCCWAARHALAASGDFVECGVNRGGISRSVVEYVNFGTLSRKFYLLDTFCGDPNVASVNQQDYADCFADVQKTFSPFSNVVLIKGRIPETLNHVPTERVSFLSIDLNNSDPEIAALRFFWPKLVSGAITILDDYAYSSDYEKQRLAMDGLGAELGFSVLTLPTGQGMIVKV
jgi:O-methyltransferase